MTFPRINRWRQDKLVISPAKDENNYISASSWQALTWPPAGLGCIRPPSGSGLARSCCPPSHCWTLSRTRCCSRLNTEWRLLLCVSTFNCLALLRYLFLRKYWLYCCECYAHPSSQWMWVFPLPQLSVVSKPKQF